MHDNHGTCGSDDGEPEHLAGVNQNGVHRADRNKLVSFDPAARVHQQHGQTFTIGVEMRVAGDVQPPVGGQPPVGIAGLACLACLAVIHYATEPLLSHLLVWWCRLLIYLAAPIAAAFTILYHSSWHREFSRVRRPLLSAFHLA
jgi:hypothetical protein